MNTFETLRKEAAGMIGATMRMLLATAIVVCCEDMDDYLAQLLYKKK